MHEFINNHPEAGKTEERREFLGNMRETNPQLFTPDQQATLYRAVLTIKKPDIGHLKYIDIDRSNERSNH